MHERVIRRKATEISTRFCALGTIVKTLHPKCFIIEVLLFQSSEVLELRPTYSKNSGIVRHLRWFVLFWWGGFLDSQIYNVATPEDYVVIDIVRRRNHFIRTPIFCAEGFHVLECDCRSLGVDFVESANIASSSSEESTKEISSMFNTVCPSSRPARCASY